MNVKVIVRGVLVASAIIASAWVPKTAAHATDQQGCVSGADSSNLQVTWKSNSTVTVGTKDDKSLCKDQTIYFSSYTMPDNYNGQPFDNNPTATPQTLFDSTSAVLKQGSTEPVTLTIKLPEACKNTQVDVYYPPEITSVTPAGHGSQYITGKILVKTKSECTPPPAPVYACTALTAHLISGTKYSFNGAATAKNGATITSYTFDFGDGKTQTVTNPGNVTHEYAQNGKTYTVKLSVLVNVNGDTKTITSNDCQTTITVAKTPECKPGIPEGDARCETTPVTPSSSTTPTTPTTPATPTVLPQTGASQNLTAMLGLGSLIASVSYYVTSRRGLIGSLRG